MLACALGDPRVGVVGLRPGQRVRVVDLPGQRGPKRGVLGQEIEQDGCARARLPDDEDRPGDRLALRQSGFSLRHLVICSLLDQRRTMSNTAISTPRSFSRASDDQPVTQQCQPVAPAVVGAEVVAARLFAGLLDEPVGLETLGSHETASPRKTLVRTSGGSGLSSHRSTMKPRRRPPVSSQWPCPKSLAPMPIRTIPSPPG